MVKTILCAIAQWTDDHQIGIGEIRGGALIELIVGEIMNGL